MNEVEVKDKDIDTAAAGNAAVAPAEAPSHPLPVWLAVALALASWAILIWSNGYAALACGCAGVAFGFWGAAKNRGALRRLAVTAIIASAVPVVVLAAFLIVIKIGLSR